MRRSFDVPARYLAEVEAVLTDLHDRIAADQQAPGAVPPFMVDSRRAGVVRVSIDIVAAHTGGSGEALVRSTSNPPHIRGSNASVTPLSPSYSETRPA